MNKISFEEALENLTIVDDVTLIELANSDELVTADLADVLLLTQELASRLEEFQTAIYTEYEDDGEEDEHYSGNEFND